MKVAVGNLLVINGALLSSNNPISVSLDTYNYDVIYEDITSMQTFKCGIPQSPIS